MASSMGTTLKNVTSAFQRLGVFTGAVATNEPKAAPGKGYTCAIFAASMAPAAAASGLNGASGLYVFTVRIYTDFLAEPVDQIDPNLVAVVDKALDAIAGDFDLGATVRNVDFFGSEGTPLRVDFGYVEVSGKMCRIADITLPVIVNNTMTWTA